MRSELHDTMANLNESYKSGRLLDVALVAIYKHGKSTAEYTPGIEDRASNVIGYLTCLCHDLTPFVRR